MSSSPVNEKTPPLASGRPVASGNNSSKRKNHEQREKRRQTICKSAFIPQERSARGKCGDTSCRNAPRRPGCLRQGGRRWRTNYQRGHRYSDVPERFRAGRGRSLDSVCGTWRRHKSGLSPIDLELNGKTITTGLAPNYITALEVLDEDMPQYIVDNTDDEISHHQFLNNYLASKGAKPIDLSHFAILPPSQVTGVPRNGRLTNLKQLTVDTTWWTRYRSATQNPDFGGKFENAVPDLAKGQHPAIPVSDADLVLNSDGTIPDHLQAIANTAGFHFAFIEQGGSSLYPALAQKVTNLEVLRVLLSIGGSEIMHFQVWHDKAGNAANITDGDLTFPDLNAGVDPNTGASGSNVADEFQTNLIMPEPTLFLSQKARACSDRTPNF
jgi:hypothetical protein